jgi:hypothetical protein
VMYGTAVHGSQQSVSQVCNFYNVVRGQWSHFFDLLILFQCLCDGVSRRWSRSHLRLVLVWARDSVSRRWSRSHPCLVLCVGMRRCVETVVSLPSLSGASCGHATVCRDGGLAPIPVWCFVWACDGVSRRWSRSRPCLVLRVGMRQCVETVVSLPSVSGALCGHATVRRDDGLTPVHVFSFALRPRDGLSGW